MATVRVFLGWSGSRSKRLAKALEKYLPVVVPTARPYFSPNSPAGPFWSTPLSRALRNADYAILCLTADNRESPWLNFEAGALWGARKKACILRLGVTEKQLKPPISLFVSKACTTQDVRSICRQIAGLAGARRGFHARFTAAWDRIRKEAGLQRPKKGLAPKKK